jgi:predicted HicB family RNase H-like nuclease
VDILKYKDYEGTAELDMERMVCRGKILFINDLVTYEAAHPKNLQAEFEAAVDDYLQTCAQLNRLPAKPFRGLFNVRVKPDTHRAAALYAAAHEMSLNAVVECALDLFLHKTEVTHKHQIQLSFDDESSQTLSTTASSQQAQEIVKSVHAHH